MAERMPVWSYGSRAQRRQREQASLQQLGGQIAPMVGQGDPASMARARAMTNIEARAERTAAFRANVQAKMREAAGVPSDRESMGIAPAKKKGRGLLGKVGGALGDVAGEVSERAGDALGVAKDVGADVVDEAPGFLKRAGSAGLTALDAPRKYAGGPAWAIATGSLKSDRKPILDAQGNPTGRYYRSTPNFGDMAHSVAAALTSNPVDTYQAAQQANEERLADPEMGTFGRVLTSGLQDPLTWVGPGAVKGALKFAPAAVKASKGARAAAAVLEQPKAVGLGGVVGSAAAAQGAEDAGLGPKGQLVATLAGGAVGGVGGGLVGARGVRQSLKDMDTGLAKAQGRSGKRAAIGLGIEDTHPDFETYIRELEDQDIAWAFGKNGEVVIENVDDALTKADRLATEAHDAWENRAGQWIGGGHRTFEGDGTFSVGGRTVYASDMGPGAGASGSMARKRATGGVDANRAMDRAERIWEAVNAGTPDPRMEQLRKPWAEGAALPAYMPLPADQKRMLEVAWDELAKGRAAGEVESKRLAARLGVARADEFVTERVRPGYSPRATARDIYAEIEAAEMFEAKRKPAKPGSDARETVLPMVDRAYVERLREIANDLEANGHEAGKGLGYGNEAGGVLPAATAGDGGTAGLAGDAGPGSSGVAEAIDAGAGGRAATGAQGANEQVIRTPGKPDVRVLGERGKGRVVAFDWDAGAGVKVGDRIATPYGSVVVVGVESTGTGATQIRGKFERSSKKHGVLVSDTVLVRQPSVGMPVMGTPFPASVAGPGGEVPYPASRGIGVPAETPAHGIASMSTGPEAPASNMTAEFGPNHEVVAWHFTGGRIERTPDGEWQLDYEGRRYVGDTADDVVAQVEAGPGADEFDAAVFEEDAPAVDRSAFERPLADGGMGEPPVDPPAPAAFGDPDEFSNVDPERVRADLAGVVERPLLEEPDWLRNQFEASLQADHEFGLRATENITALGGDPRDLPVNLEAMKPGLTRMDRAGNAVKRMLGIGVEEDPLATPVMRARKNAQPIINSQAARLGALSQRIVSEVFERDAKGRIPSLPGEPTIQDVAAALPRFEPMLSADQLAVMRRLQRELEPYSRLIREEAGIDIDSRADVQVGGGFYMPRGRAELEGMDLPAKVSSGRYLGQGTRKGFEKEAIFLTQAEGIEAGFEYPDIGETMQSYARDAGRRSIDKYTSDYFASLKNEAGQRLGMSYADRIDEELRGKHQKAVESLAKIRGRLATAERRAGVTAAQTDELDTALMAFTEAASSAPDLRPVSRELQAQRRTAKRLRRGQPGIRVSVDEAGNVVTHHEPFVEADTINRVITAFEDLMPDSLDYADAVDRSIATTARRLADLEKRGLRWKGEADALKGQLERAERELNTVQPAYRNAVNQARKATRGTAQIGFVQLQGRAFPIELANVANKWLQAERPPMGKFAGTTVAVDALNNLLRGLRATGDASFLGIQGLLGATRDPKAYGTATRVAWKALSDPTVLGSHIRDFDAKAAARDLPTSRDWARVNLHIGGADTEFAIQAKGLTRLGKKVQDLPVAKQSNRAFGYFGDVARLEIADTIAASKKAAGIELTDDVLREIATVSDLMTGWSPNTFGGSVGQLAQFAPRFFQSQLELIGKLVSGGQIEKSEARKAMVRLLGVSVGVTLLANELSPEGLPPEKVLSPFRDPKDPRSGMNSNFLRFRVGGTDATLLGPWDSLLRGLVETAGAAADQLPFVESKGSGSYLLRSKASPALGLAWDLFSGETAIGDNASLKDPEYMIRSFLPFSVSDLGTDDLSVQGAAGLAVGMTGVKASPLSATEHLDRVAQAQFGKDFYDLEASQQKGIKDEHPDLWQRAVERGNAQRRRRETLRLELEAMQKASDENLLSGKTTREDWIAEMQRRRDELAARSKEIYGEGGVGKPKDALDRYYAAIDDARDEATGEVDWGQVDSWQSQQSEADQAYVDRNTGLNGTPLVQLYRKLSREYYSLPRYRGYDADQARQIDELYTAVTNLATGDSKLAKSAKLKDAAAMVGADEEIVKAVRRRIYGMLQETTDRAKWKKAHPESAVFLGRGQLLPDDIEALAGVLPK